MARGSSPASDCCIHLLGTLRVEHDSHVVSLPTEKTRSLLAYLVLHPGVQSREKLMTLFWGDSPSAKAQGSLRKALSFLRQTISRELILADRETIQLNPSFVLWVDIAEFEQQAREFLADPSPDLNCVNFDLYQGDLLSDFYDDWIPPLREHYHALYVDTMLRAIEHLRAQSEYKTAIAYAQRILTLDPANERAHQHLMFCYITLGDRDRALQQYEACQRALRDELAVEPTRETQALYNWIKQSASEISSLAARLTNLPIPISSFVGRERELTRAKQLLSSARLVTLTGAGGSGKTRLAIHAATDLIDSFKDGVWWVELAPLNDPLLVPSAVAKALGVSTQTDQPLKDVLSRFLGNKRTLLVLDNCEHLIDACARLVEHLLNTCPDLKILCTSRESLGLTGETVWHVPTLSLPDRKTASLADLLMEYEGIRLFVERATAVNPDFTLTDQNALAIVQICQRLDGIPLALELAAARVKMMPVDQIASRLEDRFHLLTAENRTSQARHHTLRAAIDWSYDLLSDDERRLFYRLSVFSGGWTLDAAELVCSGKGIERNDILNLLARLVDKSLVIIADGQRYGMLETIKQYAAEKLARSNKSDCVYGRHLDYYLKLARMGDERIRGHEQMTWQILLKAEQDNFAGALDRSLGSHETLEKGCELVCALCWYWKMVGDLSIVKYWLELALSRSIHLAKSPARASLLFNICYFSTLGIDWLKPLQARSAIEQSLEIWHELGPDFADQNARSLLLLGWIQKRYFDNEEGYDYINQAARFFEEKGDVWWQAFALNFLGSGLVDDSKDMLLIQKVLEKEAALWEKTGDQCISIVVLWDLSGLACERKDFLEAQSLLKKALQILMKLGAKSLILQTLVHLGDVARAMKQYELAEFYYKESMPLVQTTLHFLWLPRINQGLGYVMLGKGDLQQADKYFHRALSESREINIKHGQVHFVAGYAALEVLRVRLDFAACLFGAFFAQPESLHSDMKTDQKILFLVDQLEIEGYLDRCRSQMDQVAFEKAWNEGSVLSLEDALNLIMKETEFG